MDDLDVAADVATSEVVFRPLARNHGKHQLRS
jgi:hypothetical protein